MLGSPEVYSGEIRSMTKMLGVAALAGAVLCLQIRAAVAQDVPGIEICTVEKTMERRTSCLQSNIDYLKKTATQSALDQQRKLDAANRAIEALQAQVQSLQATVTALKAAAEQAKPKTPPPADTKPALPPVSAPPPN